MKILLFLALAAIPAGKKHVSILYSIVFCTELSPRQRPSCYAYQVLGISYRIFLVYSVIRHDIALDVPSVQGVCYISWEHKERDQIYPFWMLSWCAMLILAMDNSALSQCINAWIWVCKFTGYVSLSSSSRERQCFVIIVVFFWAYALVTLFVFCLYWTKSWGCFEDDVEMEQFRHKCRQFYLRYSRAILVLCNFFVTFSRCCRCCCHCRSRLFCPNSLMYKDAHESGCVQLAPGMVLNGRAQKINNLSATRTFFLLSITTVLKFEASFSAGIVSHWGWHTASLRGTAYGIFKGINIIKMRTAAWSKNRTKAKRKRN